jgi:hypothetical protein
MGWGLKNLGTRAGVRARLHQPDGLLLAGAVVGDRHLDELDEAGHAVGVGVGDGDGDGRAVAEGDHRVRGQRRVGADEQVGGRAAPGAVGVVRRGDTCRSRSCARPSRSPRPDTTASCERTAGACSQGRVAGRATREPVRDGPRDRALHGGDNEVTFRPRVIQLQYPIRDRSEGDRQPR